MRPEERRVLDEVMELMEEERSRDGRGQEGRRR